MTDPDLVHAAVERDLAEALGASPDDAAAAVAVITEAGLLRHGIIVIAEVMAARKGVEVLDALELLAGGEDVPGGISEYELRVAAEEGEDDVDRAWSARGPAAEEGPWGRLRRRVDITLGDMTADDGTHGSQAVATPFRIRVDDRFRN